MRSVADIDHNIATFLGKRRPTDRYTSFDYCFNYFQSHREEGRVSDLVKGPALQVSCLQLGFYLASWGMFRASAVLLQRSLQYLASVVTVIAGAPVEIWQVDADDYSDRVCGLVIDVGELIRNAFRDGATDTLVTKTMLGVFGCIPAFDAYFKSGSGLSTFGPGSFQEIAKFYDQNRAVIDRHRVRTLDFETGRPTERRHSRAKVIDMIFFIEGSVSPSRR